MPHRKDIDMRCVHTALALAELHGLSVGALLAGLPVRAEEVTSLAAAVTWDAYVELLERMARAAGGEAELERIFERSPEATPRYTEVAAMFVTPRRLLHFLMSVVTPPLMPCVAIEVNDCDDGRVGVSMRARRGYRDGRPVWHATVGTLRTLPARIGLRRATVDATLRPGGADYVVALPPPGRIPTPAQRDAVTAFAQFAFDELSRHAEAVARRARLAADHDVAHALERARAEWRLTPRECEVLGYVVHGFANKEIASQTSCAQITVENHVSALFRKAAARGRVDLVSKFWRTVA
jgi:DNA-binding CsgD family transcriptional regulator